MTGTFAGLPLPVVAPMPDRFDRFGSGGREIPASIVTGATPLPVHGFGNGPAGHGRRDA